MSLKSSEWSAGAGQNPFVNTPVDLCDVKMKAVFLSEKKRFFFNFFPEKLSGLPFGKPLRCSNAKTILTGWAIRCSVGHFLFRSPRDSTCDTLSWHFFRLFFHLPLEPSSPEKPAHPQLTDSLIEDDQLSDRKLSAPSYLTKLNDSCCQRKIYRLQCRVALIAPVQH